MGHFTTKGQDTAQAALVLLNEANAHPLPLDEVLARLGATLQRNLNYLAYRARRNRQTAYDEALEQELEAIACAIHYLQRPQNEANCIECHQAPRLFDSARCAACQQIADDHWQQFQQRQAQQKAASQRTLRTASSQAERPEGGNTDA